MNRIFIRKLNEIRANTYNEDIDDLKECVHSLSKFNYAIKFNINNYIVEANRYSLKESLYYETSIEMDYISDAVRYYKEATEKISIFNNIIEYAQFVSNC